MVFTTYVLVSPENYLSPEVAFVSISVINILNWPASFLPMFLAYCAQVRGTTLTWKGHHDDWFVLHIFAWKEIFSFWQTEMFHFDFFITGCMRFFLKSYLSRLPCIFPRAAVIYNGLLEISAKCQVLVLICTKTMKTVLKITHYQIRSLLFPRHIYPWNVLRGYFNKRIWMRMLWRLSLHWVNITASQRTRDAIMTSLLRQNDVATSFWRNNDVIIVSRVRWDSMHILYRHWPFVWGIPTGYWQIFHAKN